MPAELGERTEAPTQRRREEARERGQITRSIELTAAVLLLGSMLSLRWFGLGLVERMSLLLEQTLGAHSRPGEELGALANLGARVLWLAAASVLPIMLTLSALAVVSNLMQVGPLLTWHPIQPQFGKINPLAGFQRLFSARSAVLLAVSLMKLTLVVWAAWSEIGARLPEILATLELEPRPLLAASADLSYWLAIKMSAVLFVLAALDYGYQRWQHERDLRMTKEEVREEMRRMEGDPLLKHRRRQIALQIAQQRLRRDVPKADVIVTNPTELAVALRYDTATMHAPVVVAKGADLLARRIREIAAEHRIPIVQRKPLAQALFKSVEVGQEIPAGLYQAVAEILAYVYELNGKVKRRAAG